MSVKHEFTGVFIPAHIWLSKELIPAEKMMLGEITALSIKTGWCNAGRKHFAGWLGCDLPCVTYYIKKLEYLGFIEVKRESGVNNKMRVVVSRLYPSVPLTGVVSPTDPPRQSHLPHKIQYKENNKTLSPRIRENEALGAEQTHIQTGAGPAVSVEVHDPVAPGVKIMDVVPGQPQTPVMPKEPERARINLGDRPNAETPAQLEKAMQDFYRCPDWKNEWLDGVCRISGVWIPDDPKKPEQLKGMLSDFCRHAVKNNRGGDTYRMLNAAFQSWVANERYAGWKNQPAKAKTANNPGANATYEPPKNAVY